MKKKNMWKGPLNIMKRHITKKMKKKNMWRRPLNIMKRHITKKIQANKAAP
jgi:hypothetical protein